MQEDDYILRKMLVKSLLGRSSLNEYTNRKESPLPLYKCAFFFVVVAALVQEPRKRGPGFGINIFGNCTFILLYKKVYLRWRCIKKSFFGASPQTTISHQFLLCVYQSFFLRCRISSIQHLSYPLPESRKSHGSTAVSRRKVS